MTKSQALQELYDNTVVNGHKVYTASFSCGKTEFACRCCPAEGRLIRNKLVFVHKCDNSFSNPVTTS